jgi:type 1 glutamine amidotransferase/PKD repeat protein
MSILTSIRVRLAVALVVIGSLAVPVSAAAAKKPSFNVLVFSKTAAFRHDSIPAGIQAITQLGTQNGFAVTATEDATRFNDRELVKYAAVIFLSTTGDVLNAEQQAAFERYIRAGRGFVGIHAASDTEYEWPFYGELVGGYFSSHPAIQRATVKVADRVHPSTSMLPDRWNRTDEWYDFRTNPRGKVHVLATLDGTTYDGDTMGSDHPTAWCQDYVGGRSWYTGGGHTQESYAEPLFRAHILGGIRWAAGAMPGDCGATVDANFEKVTLNDEPGEPMALAVLPDLRVLHNTRPGKVWMHDPQTRTNKVIGSFDGQPGSLPALYTHDEEGLQSIAIDPNFATNHWVYIYYSPRLNTPTGDAPDEGTAQTWATWKGALYLSRFKLVGDTLDPASEQVILQVPVDRGICCHVGGKVDFDNQGNLYLSTGDDTNPFASDGYAPIDERKKRNPAYDAQRSAANTNDLRGKVLRIKVNANGTYSIPAGNLFAATASTRPEIYVMGLRNPFRFFADTDGTLYLGDYSPDAGSASTLRGPAGTGKWTVIRAAGNYGWPYCATPELPYRDYDFAKGTSGAYFDCDHPVNESPNNTGLRVLPPTQAPDVAYSYAESSVFPELGAGGIGPMGGPVYHYNAALSSTTKFPQYYDRVPLFYEWTRDYVKEFRLDSAGNLLKINPFLAGTVFDNPMDMEFGPDGSLYTLEYGDGFFSENPEAQLARIDYVKGIRSPIAEASATPTNGAVPLTVAFSSAGSRDPDPGDSIRFAWDFDANGTTDSVDPNPTFTYTQAGRYQARLTVTDSTNKTGVDTVTITAGNTAPKVTLELPPDGGVFDFGDTVAFRAVVQDAEDQTVDCSRVAISYILGHDSHGHPLASTTGCQGTITTASDSGHDANANIVGVINASYTDNGGSLSLSGSDEAVLQPRRKQAEFFTSMQGVQTENTADVGGGINIGFIDHGDWVAFTPMNLQNITALDFRTASAGTGGRIEMRVDSPTGPMIGTVTVPVTGDWQGWTNVTMPVTDPGGTHEMFFVFVNNPGDGGLFNINWFQFVGQGVGSP